MSPERRLVPGQKHSPWVSNSRLSFLGLNLLPKQLENWTKYMEQLLSPTGDSSCPWVQTMASKGREIQEPNHCPGFLKYTSGYKEDPKAGSRFAVLRT